MRFLSFFIIIISFPLILRLENKNPKTEIADFCVPGMGYCLVYNKSHFSPPQSMTDVYGGKLTGINHPITGEFSAEVNALSMSLDQHYLERMNALQAESKDLTELNSIIADDEYYLSVRAGDELRYFHTWTRVNRLVQLELTAPVSLSQEVWEEIIHEFTVTFQ